MKEADDNSTDIQEKEIPVIGHKFIANFGEDQYLLDFVSETQLKIKVEKGMGKNQTVAIERTRIQPICIW